MSVTTQRRSARYVSHDGSAEGAEYDSQGQVRSEASTSPLEKIKTGVEP